MNTDTENFRPKSLDEFIGNVEVVKALRGWIEKWRSGKPLFPFFILYGDAGVGKSTLVYCLAKDLNLVVSEHNASDERNAADIRRVLLETGLRGFDRELRLTVLDEADNISLPAQRVLSAKYKLVKQPVVLLVNDMSRISPELSRISLKVRINRPSLLEKMTLARRVCGDNFDREKMEAVAKTSATYRDLLNHIFFGVSGADYVQDLDADDIGLVTAMFQGKIKTERLRMMPAELLRYTYQNQLATTRNWRLRKVDVWLKAADQTKEWRLWRYAFALMEFQHFDGVISAPKPEFKAKERRGKPDKVVKEAQKPIKYSQKDTEEARSVIDHKRDVLKGF